MLLIPVSMSIFGVTLYTRHVRYKSVEILAFCNFKIARAINFFFEMNIFYVRFGIIALKAQEWVVGTSVCRKMSSATWPFVAYRINKFQPQGAKVFKGSPKFWCCFVPFLDV